MLNLNPDTDTTDGQSAKVTRKPRRKLTSREIFLQQPKRSYENPHRCNPRMDDFLDSLFDYQSQIVHRGSLLWRCLFSDEGSEPTDPFLSETLDEASWWWVRDYLWCYVTMWIMYYIHVRCVKEAKKWLTNVCLLYIQLLLHSQLLFICKKNPKWIRRWSYMSTHTHTRDHVTISTY